MTLPAHQPRRPLQGDNDYMNSNGELAVALLNAYAEGRVTVQGTPTKAPSAQRVPIGKCDKHGTPIHLGDWLQFEPKVWYSDSLTEEKGPVFQVLLVEGDLQMLGVAGDLDQYCEIIPTPKEAPMTADQLIEKIENSDRKARSYSGRGMFGAQCVAVSLGREDAGGELPKGAQTESLGKGTIWYWPGIPWPEGRKEDA